MFNHKEIGIDLGHHSIKIATIDTASDRFDKKDDLHYLKECKNYLVDCEPYSDEYFKFLKNSIKDFAKENKVSFISLNLTIPLIKDSSVFFLTTPAINNKVLKEGIGFEVEQEMALRNIEDSHYTWKIVNEYEELNEYEIMLATIKKRIINSLSQFKTIKWRINRVILQPILLERITTDNDVIIDFGHELTRVYLYKSGRLNSVETISVSGKMLQDKIKEYLEVHKIEKEPMEIIESVYVPGILKDIEAKSMLDEDEIDEENKVDYEIITEISNYLSKDINNLIDEIKRIIRTFELQNGISINDVYGIGELFNLKYLKETIEADLDKSIKSLNIIAKESDDNLFAIAGLSAMDPKLKDDTDFSKLIKINIDYTSIIAAVLTLTLSLGVAFYTMNNKYDKIIEEQELIRAEQRTTIGEIEDKIAYEKQDIQVHQDFIEKMNNLKNEKKWLSDILFIIPDIIPNTIAITDMNIVSKEVTIEGYSSNYSSIGFFAKKLEKIGETEIESIVKSDEETIYTVTMNDPERISKKFLVNEKFIIKLKHNDNLLENWK